MECSDILLKKNLSTKRNIVFGGEFRAIEGVFKSSVRSFNTKIDKIVYHGNGTHVDTKDIQSVKISFSECKYMPKHLKRKFPDLKALNFGFNKLKHLDQQDMKQFGSDLILVAFLSNELTALEGDLFKFNPNLKYVYFGINPLKYIDPKLFENFKKMSLLKEVDFSTLFSESTCLDSSFSSDKNDIQTFDWNAERCYDADAERRYRKKLQKKIKKLYQSILEYIHDI